METTGMPPRLLLHQSMALNMGKTRDGHQPIKQANQSKRTIERTNSQADFQTIINRSFAHSQHDKIASEEKGKEKEKGKEEKKSIS
jgi:hypothetical protein